MVRLLFLARRDGAGPRACIQPSVWSLDKGSPAAAQPRAGSVHGGGRVTRTVVVTGSSGHILGAVKRRLETAGVRVIGVDLRSDADIVADVGTPAGREAVVEGVRERCGGVVDGVVTGPAAGGVAVCYFGAVEILERLRPMLARGTDPRAVAVASRAMLAPLARAPVVPEIVEACLAGDEALAQRLEAERADTLGAYEGQSYPSAKHALGRWLRRVAPGAAWAGNGIPLNAVAPGLVDTRGPLDEQELAESEARAPQPLHQAPLDPDAVAALVAWLASPENSITTGQVVFMDAGSDAAVRGDDIW